MRMPAIALTLLAPLAIGCSSAPPTVPNPFNTADRVPPPALQAGPTGAPPYYQPGTAAPAPALPAGSPSTFAPGQTTPSGYPAAAPGGYQAAPAPGSATPYYGSSLGPAPTTRQVAGGDTIAVPTDAGAMRFASRDDVAQARLAATPIARPGPATQLASTNQRPPVTANAWIAGSAPVRASRPEASPRVRIPGSDWDREPVSLAALDRGVRVTPLEPAPTGARPGEPAPLRVAAPPSTTGWR